MNILKTFHFVIVDLLLEKNGFMTNTKRLQLNAITYKLLQSAQERKLRKQEKCLYQRNTKAIDYPLANAILLFNCKETKIISYYQSTKQKIHKQIIYPV